MEHRFGASDHADSAGQPWAGRTFHENPAAGDDGSADPRIVEAIGAFRAGTSGPEAVVRAVGQVRLLVPLVAEAGEVGFTPEGRKVDKTQELSLVTLAGPDGRTVLPAFTSVASMAVWDPKARPIPVAGTRVALAAISDGCGAVVIDPVSETEFAVRRPALEAIVQGKDWVPCWVDEMVAESFAQSFADEPEVSVLDLLPGDPDGRLRGPELVVRLGVVPGLDRQRLEALVGRLSSRWQESPQIATSVDSLAVRIVPAT